MEKINLKAVLSDSYDLLVNGIIEDNRNVKLKKEKKKENNKDYYKYEVEGRTKLQSLTEALRQHDEPNDSVLHFIKYSEYFLPRSKFEKTLNVLLEKIDVIRERNKDKHKIIKKEIQYMVGYTLWTIDALCNIFTESSMNNEGVEKVREHIKKMIETEFKITGIVDENKKTKDIVDAIIEWYNKAGGN